MKDLWNGAYYTKHSTYQKAAALRSLNGVTLKGNERVLDIGCGSGDISKWIADRVPQGKVIGIDPSMQMLSQAISDYKNTPHLSFFQKSAETFHFDEKFDLITSFHALHFTKEKEKAFNQIKGALVSQGRMFLRIASHIHPLLKETFESEPWKSISSLEERFFPIGKEEGTILLNRCSFVIDQVEIDLNSYTFASPQVVTEWFMTWIPYISNLPEEKALELSRDLTERLCAKENCRTDIPIQMNTLNIAAHLP